MKLIFIKTFAAFATITSLSMSDCTKLDASNAPSCIQKKIKEIQSENVRNPSGSIWQYEYNGQTVYYISSYCCDIQSQLFDSNCNLICSPDGGFLGKGDGKCPDFLTNRKNEKLIWKDDRK
jgi:hypothetical protein